MLVSNIFSFFHNVFKSPSLPQLFETQDCVAKVKEINFLKQTLDSSKLKEFADNNFRFDENSGMFSKRVKKYMEKLLVMCLWKILREKEKLLMTSNFSFTHSIFKRQPTYTNMDFFRKESPIFMNFSHPQP